MIKNGFEWIKKSFEGGQEPDKAKAGWEARVPLLIKLIIRIIIKFYPKSANEAVQTTIAYMDLCSCIKLSEQGAFLPLTVPSKPAITPGFNVTFISLWVRWLWTILN